MLVERSVVWCVWKRLGPNQLSEALLLREEDGFRVGGGRVGAVIHVQGRGASTVRSTPLVRRGWEKVFRVRRELYVVREVKRKNVHIVSRVQRER